MIKPIEDKIVIKPIVEDEQVTESGLIIAGGQRPKPQIATVVAVGPGMTFPDGGKMVPDVSVGDKVYYAPYSGTEITSNGEDLLIIGYRDVFAILVDDEA